MVCDPPRRDETLIFEGKIDLKSSGQFSLDSLSSCHEAYGTYSENLFHGDYEGKRFFNFEINGLIKENSLVPLDKRKGDLRFQLQGTRESTLQNFRAYLGTIGKVTIPPPGISILLKTPPDTPNTPAAIGVTVKLPAKILLDEPK